MMCRRAALEPDPFRLKRNPVCEAGGGELRRCLALRRRPRPDPCVSVTSKSGEGIAMRATLKLPQLWLIMRAGTNHSIAFARRRGMSDTQSQTAQSGALHHGSAAIINANLVAG